MKRILVLGDIIVDNYLIGNVERVSPEAPVPVVNVNKEKLVLGGAANVVNNLLALKAEVDLISVIGDCDNRILLDKLLERNSISPRFLKTEAHRKITKKTRILSSNQQIVRYDSETTQAITEKSEAEILSVYEEHLENYSIVILSDYGKGVLTPQLTRILIKLANIRGIKVLVDPKGNDYSKYANAYLLTPNRKEAGIATQNDSETYNLKKVIQQLKDNFKLSKSIITLSGEGIALYDKELKIFPTKVKEVYDVTGAGDTVIAAIAYALANDKTIEEAITFANLAAGIVVTKIGVATPTLEEIYADTFEIKTRDELISILSTLKKKGKKIVFTNGCFDILHLGHVKYLEKAKALGDVLVVGVNSDSSVKRLKGNSRPINVEYDRAYLINALQMVDYTVIFDEDTPYELIKTIHPDILVKGGDYSVETIVGNDLVKNTTVIPFVACKSTTNLINKIRERNN